jgi:hypothetical protein
MPIWRNWAGNQRSRPAIVERPASESEVVAVVNRAVSNRQRVKVQGSADVAMSLFGGVAGFSSGFIRKAWGFPWLSMLGTMIVLFLLALLLLNVERFKLQEA